MIAKKLTAAFLFLFFSFCECGFVDHMPKCRISDNECLRNLYESMVRDIGKTGIPEYGIPPFDPIELKDVSINVLNLVNITMVQGNAKGFKDCIFKKFIIDITKERGQHENICDITIKGHYTANSDSPFIKSMLKSSDIYADGNGFVKIEKLCLKYDYTLYAQKRSDGEIYLKCLWDQIKYEYEILGQTTFRADGIYVGGRDISKTIMPMLNANSGDMMKTFGKPFVDKGMTEYYFKFASYFFDRVPARYYIIDDLTPYAKP